MFLLLYFIRTLTGENKERIPLILTNDLAVEWVKNTLADVDIQYVLDYSFPANEMEAWPMDSVRKAKVDDEHVIERMEYDGLPGIG